MDTTKPKTNIYQLDCKHDFCFDCVCKLVKSNDLIHCPICRTITNTNHNYKSIKLTLEIVSTCGSRYHLVISPYKTVKYLHQIIGSRYSNNLEKTWIRFGDKILDKYSDTKIIDLGIKHGSQLIWTYK